MVIEERGVESGDRLGFNGGGPLHETGVGEGTGELLGRVTATVQLQQSGEFFETFAVKDDLLATKVHFHFVVRHGGCGEGWLKRSEMKIYRDQ